MSRADSYAVFDALRTYLEREETLAAVVEVELIAD